MTKIYNKCLLSVATYKYLSKAIVLSESFVAVNPDCDVLLFVPDLSQRKISSVKWPVPSSINILGLDEIGDPFIQKMHQYFDAFEMCCASKSFLIGYALFKIGYEKVILLDPDIVCYAPFNEVWMTLDKTDMVLTPHTFSILPDDGFLPDDNEFVTTGFINGGFWSAVRTDATRHIIEWVKKKVVHFGFFIPNINLYADQTWMSCLPWYFPDNIIVNRNPGLNVAYWNLHERDLTQENGEYLSNKHKLVFIHFSGYNEDKPAELTLHTLRKVSDENNVIIKKVVLDYSKRLKKVSHKLPKIEPDLPCNNLHLSKRIKIYEKVYGRKPQFINIMENKLLSGKLTKQLFNKAMTIMRKVV